MGTVIAVPVFSQARTTQAKADPAAYAMLERASKARQTMPDDVVSVSGTVTFISEGRTVSGTFEYSAERRAEIKVDGLDAKGSDELRSQVSSIFGHRTSGDFANGNGRYPITFADEATTGTRRIALNDESKSFFRVRKDEIVEVDREMHGSRFLITMLETKRTSEGKSLPKVFVVSYFDPQTKALLRSQYFKDDFTRVNGVWIPKRREVTTTGAGETTSFEIRFDRLKVVREDKG